MSLILILYDKIKEGDTMYFLIGVIIFILFIIFCYLYIKFKIKNILGKHGFNGMSLKDIIEEEITQKLGEENMKLIKKLLECEWIK